MVSISYCIQAIVNTNYGEFNNNNNNNKNENEVVKVSGHGPRAKFG